MPASASRDRGLDARPSMAACGRSRVWTIAELKREFETVSETMAVMECAGNGRAFFPHPAGTVLWRHGAVGCVRWTGVRWATCCDAAGCCLQAIHTGHHSARRLSRRLGACDLARLPIRRALAPETLVAFGAQRRPFPGCTAARCVSPHPAIPAHRFRKWLTRIEVRTTASTTANGCATAITGCRARRCGATASRSMPRNSRSSPTCR